MTCLSNIVFQASFTLNTASFSRNIFHQAAQQIVVEEIEMETKYLSSILMFIYNEMLEVHKLDILATTFSGHTRKVRTFVNIS